MTQNKTKKYEIFRKDKKKFGSRGLLDNQRILMARKWSNCGLQYKRSTIWGA